MYAKVSMFRFRRGGAAEGVQIVNNSVLPDAREQAGFRGAIGLSLDESNQGIVITLWETEADLLASGPGPHYATQRNELARLDDLLASPPVQNIYKVEFQMEPPEA